MGRPNEAVDSNVEPNLVEPNYKSEHDTNVNGGYSAVQITKKMLKIQNAERACFSGKCDQGEQKVTPDVVSTKQPKLVWLLLLVIPKGTSQFFAKFFVVNGFFKIHLFCYFLLRTWLAVRHYTILPSFYG